MQRFEIGHIFSQNEALRDPKWGQEAPKMGAKVEKNMIWGQQCSQGITKIGSGQCQSPLGEDFWLPQGTPKSTKIGTLGENGGPRAVIFLIFAEKGAATHFFIDLSTIFE